MTCRECLLAKNAVLIKNLERMAYGGLLERVLDNKFALTDEELPKEGAAVRRRTRNDVQA